MGKEWSRWLPVALTLLVLSACSKLSQASANHAPIRRENIAPAILPVIPNKLPIAATGNSVRTEVPVQPDGGTFAVPVMINGVVSLNFTIDSGAADVAIPADVAGTLVRSGSLTRDDLIGSKTFVMANGEEVPSAEFRLHTLKVGTLILHDVVASVSDARGALLLGQSFLSRLETWSFDNSRHVLVLKAAGAGVEAGAASPARPDLGPFQSQVASSVATNGKDPNLTPDTAAIRAVSYLAAWSDPADPSGERVRPYYGPLVRFYGNDLTSEKLMAQKRAFTSRWPVRRYTPRERTITAQCPDERTCQVSGVLDWEAADPNSGRQSVGVASFSMIFRDGLIVGESGSVLSRQ